MADTRKIAVVFFNLGGPDSPDAVKPFLFNLFNDKAIIGAPNPIRWCIAKLISTRRAPVAQEIYQELGGGSPLLPNTQAQIDAVDAYLEQETSENIQIKSFIAMRYWHPFSSETVEKVQSWGADEVILLPLYPQFSTTTTESSIEDWHRSAAHMGFLKPTEAICCYPTGDGFVKAVAALIRASLAKMHEAGIKDNIRILYTSHGLPEKVVEKGDPYQWQCEKTAKAIAKEVEDDFANFANSDWVSCYQSRVGPLDWIEPYTEDEIARAGQDGKSILMVPIAFVSEHSETLVELDIEYKDLAEEKNVPHYERVATVSTHPLFIENLGQMILQQIDKGISDGICSDQGFKICPVKYGRCICKG